MATAVGTRAHRFIREADDCAVAPATLPHVTPAKMLNRIRLVARTLEDEPGLTARELAERAGVARRHMSLLLLRLEEHGLVVREGRRWFPGAEPIH